MEKEMHVCMCVCVCASQTFDKSSVSSQAGKTKPGWDLMLMVQWLVECHIGIMQEKVLWQSLILRFVPFNHFNNGLNKGVVCFRYSWSMYAAGVMLDDLHHYIIWGDKCIFTKFIDDLIQRIS